VVKSWINERFLAIISPFLPQAVTRFVMTETSRLSVLLVYATRRTANCVGLAILIGTYQLVNDIQVMPESDRDVNLQPPDYSATQPLATLLSSPSAHQQSVSSFTCRMPFLTNIVHQGSHSFTDKKNPGLFQDFPEPHEKFSRTFSEPANV